MEFKESRPMDFDDNDFLVGQLKKGEERAYMYLINQYHKKLHAYANGLINDQALAEDIVQNVFLKTWRFRKKLDAYPSVKKFLFRSIYNEFLDTYRKNKAVTLLEQKYVESLDQILEEENEIALEKMINLIKKEVRKLPPSCKKIFILSKEEGLTYMEIAEHLNISTKTVEAQITKAFKILRTKLRYSHELLLFIIFYESQTA
ncbi:MAG: RNA polymerase sigma-70 factor [Leeuwenhoekiella sp.]